MNNKLISVLFIGLGICITVIGTFMIIKNNSFNNDANNNIDNIANNDEPSEDETESENRKNEEDCLNDYINQNFKQIIVSDNEIVVKIDFLKSIKQVETSSGVKYQSGEGKFTLELTLREGDIEVYTKEIYDNLSKKSESEYNNIRNQTLKTVKDIKYNMVALIEKDAEKNDKMATYNILYPIDEKKFLQIETIYKDGVLEDGFFENIINSIEIEKK